MSIFAKMSALMFGTDLIDQTERVVTFMPRPCSTELTDEFLERYATQLEEARRYAQKKRDEMFHTSGPRVLTAEFLNGLVQENEQRRMSMGKGTPIAAVLNYPVRSVQL